MQLVNSSVVDPVCLSRIRLFSIPDPGTASRNLSILSQKNGFYALGNMIRVVHPRSRIRILTSYPSRIPDPGSRGQKGTRSRIRIRNTGQQFGGIKQNHKKCSTGKMWPTLRRYFTAEKDQISLETESIILHESVKKVEILHPL